MTAVTDATFEQAVIARSSEVPVVVDLWAPWCGPCKTLGPMLEAAIAATGGAVELATVNIDENPQVAASFRVQSIPAVFALRDGQVVDRFVGAVPEAQIQAFVEGLSPPPSEVELLVASGDEASLRKALEIQADHPEAVAGLARFLIDRGTSEDALSLLARVPETPVIRALAAEARLAEKGGALGDDIDARLEALLALVHDDEAAKQEYLDVLETLGAADPRTARYRKALAAKLF